MSGCPKAPGLLRHLLDSVEISEIIAVDGRIDQSDTLHSVLSLTTIGAILDDGPVAVRLDGATDITERGTRVTNAELSANLGLGERVAIGKVRDDLTLGRVAVHVEHSFCCSI